MNFQKLKTKLTIKNAFWTADKVLMIQRWYEFAVEHLSVFFE